MTTGSVLGVASLLAVAAAPSLPWFFAAWALAGLAQSALLYPPAFAALTRWYGPRRVRALTTVALVGGLGWRTTDVTLAAALGIITLPLHVTLLTPPWPAYIHRGARSDSPRQVRPVLHSRAFAFLVIAMALGAFGLYAATVDVGSLLTGQGTSDNLAAFALGLVGIGQVCGRLGYTLSRHTTASRRAAIILASGAVAVILLGAASAIPATALAVAVLAGAARGTYTLLQATAVADRWGTAQFATLNAIFLAPITTAMALAPGGGTLLMGWLGTPRTAYYLLAALIALGALLALTTRILDTAPEADAR
jgi:hypothetical protein